MVLELWYPVVIWMWLEASARLWKGKTEAAAIASLASIQCWLATFSNNSYLFPVLINLGSSAYLETNKNTTMNIIYIYM